MYFYRRHIWYMPPGYRSIRLRSYCLFRLGTMTLQHVQGGLHSHPNGLENTLVSEHWLRSSLYVSACSACYPIVCQSSIWFLAFTMMTSRLSRSIQLPLHTADNKKSNPKKWVGLFIKRTLSVFFNLIAALAIFVRQTKEKSLKPKSGTFIMNTGLSHRLTPYPQDSLPWRCGFVALFQFFSSQKQKSSKPKLEALWCG